MVVETVPGIFSSDSSYNTVIILSTFCFIAISELQWLAAEEVICIDCSYTVLVVKQLNVLVLYIVIDSFSTWF